MKNYKFLIIAFLLSNMVSIPSAESKTYYNNLIHYINKQKNKAPAYYRAPSDTQIELIREAVFYLLQREFAGATRAANLVGYNLRTIIYSGHTYYILESKDQKNRPWGTFVFYLGSDNNAYIIEVPHPDEKNTHIIGIKCFINYRSPTAATYFPIAFLMSGTSRKVYDVSSNTPNVFQAVHEEVAFYANARVLQIHGFTNRQYPQAVLTSGAAGPISAMDDLIDRLMQDDFEVGIYNGIQYIDCGATQNEQAIYTNSIGGSFIGIYLNREIHNSKAKSNLVIDSIEEYTLSETVAVETPTVR